MYNLISSINLDKLLAFSSVFLFFSLKNSLQNYQNKQTEKIKCSTSNENWWKIEKTCCWSLLTSRVSSSKGGSAVGPLTPLWLHGLFIFLFSKTLHSWSQGWRESQGEGMRGGEREVERGTGGWMVVRREDQTHCNAKKTSTPSSTPRALHPNRLFYSPSTPLGKVKPPPTGSGSSAPASSGRCSGSSFDGLLTSHQPSGCPCEERHTQMSDHRL